MHLWSSYILVFGCINLQDSGTVAGEYGTEKASAGGSLSATRTSTKENAAAIQSYIYTMDLKCQEATASLATYNKLYWNAHFINELRLLPDAFDASTSTVSSNLDGSAPMSKYEEFWETYGTHVVKSGPSYEVQCIQLIATVCRKWMQNSHSYSIKLSDNEYQM